MTNQPTELLTEGLKTGLQAVKYHRGKLEVLNQLRLPHEFVYDDVSTCEEAFDCIKSMRVRGIHLEKSKKAFQLLSLSQGRLQLQLWQHWHWLWSSTIRNMVSFQAWSCSVQSTDGM